MEWKLLQENIFAQSWFKFVTSFKSITISITLKPQEYTQFFSLDTSDVAPSCGGRQQPCENGRRRISGNQGRQLALTEQLATHCRQCVDAVVAWLYQNPQNWALLSLFSLIKRLILEMQIDINLHT